MNYLTVQQVCDKHGLTPRQIYYAIATNKIKARRIADVYWITPQQVAKLLKGKEGQTS